jgi:hypothetical protein
MKGQGREENSEEKRKSSFSFSKTDEKANRLPIRSQKRNPESPLRNRQTDI